MLFARVKKWQKEYRFNSTLGNHSDRADRSLVPLRTEGRLITGAPREADRLSGGKAEQRQGADRSRKRDRGPDIPHAG